MFAIALHDRRRVILCESLRPTTFPWLTSLLFVEPRNKGLVCPRLLAKFFFLAVFQERSDIFFTFVTLGSSTSLRHLVKALFGVELLSKEVRPLFLQDM